ncbi:MAG: VanZ family protein [Eubacteriales bacterium]|nr:VanZ family protein [Eubacteriales bacterium]
MSYITMEIWTGIWILARLIPTALVIYAGVMIIELGIKFILKKKIEIRIFNWLCQFLWILIIVSILKITGIIGGSFGISSPFDSYISFKLFEDGFNAATILNICLFIPYGFLPVFIFKKLRKHWWNGLILGAVFSIGIEFLQTYIGRYAQLDDVIMNTAGTLLGFFIARGLLCIRNKRHCEE